MSDRRSIGVVTALTAAGMLIWAAHFTTVYGFAGLACARGFASLRIYDVAVVPFTVAAATAVALPAALVVLAVAWRAGRRARDEASRFLWDTSRLLALLAIVGIAWAGLPALFVEPC